MTKKKRKPAASMKHSPISMIMEREVNMLMDLLQSQSFSSLEEANTYLRTIAGKPLQQPSGPLSDKEKAQELVYQAFAVSSADEALRLVDKALKLDPQNVDALSFKAEFSEDVGLTLQYYEQALELAKKELGDNFEEYKGDFWGFHETRPYMRARAGYGAALYFVGRYQEAMDNHWEMLGLNPEDNQGIRYELALWLLEQRDFRSYDKLHHMYPEDRTAAWLYTYALYLFLTEGESSQSHQALKKAIKQNKHVPAYLLGIKAIPKQLPDFIGYGDTNEAVDYATASQLLWKKTPMAFVWLRKHCRK